MRRVDAFESGRHHQRNSTRPVRGKVLDPQQVQSNSCAQAAREPNARADRDKESYRWLENLRQSIALLGSPERCVHIGDRESDIYELFSLAQDLGRGFLCAFRPIGWLNQRRRPRRRMRPSRVRSTCRGPLVRPPPGRELAVKMAKLLSCRSNSPRGKHCRQSASKSANRRKRSSIFMPWWSTHRRIVTRSTGSS